MTSGSDDPIKALEKRALNFLVNEYLLLNNYKLASVTFAEENEDQDYEDWDDVGLNISRPPDLLHLFRDFGSHLTPTSETCEYGCQVDIEEDHSQQEQDWDNLRDDLENQIAELQDRLHSIASEKDVLSETLHTITGERDSLSETLKFTQNHYSQEFHPSITVNNPSQNSFRKGEVNAVGEEAVDGITPEIENSEFGNCGNVTEERVLINGLEREPGEGMDRSENLADTVFQNVEPSPKEEVRLGDSFTDLDKRKISAAFQKSLLDVCFSVAKDNRIVTEVSKIADSSGENVVLMLGRCLPHIVPNVLLAKREELIPLILCTAMLHPDPRERDNLLNILFNLIKKPDEEQRQMILTGCVAFAQQVGPTRVETELLPQCWEQISHKYMERRLLVAEACGALAHYLPNEIRSSLVLSMLHQMLLDEKDDEVRESVVRSLGLLMGFICDKDKYSQASELLKSALRDPSDRVAMAAQQIFLPSFASWSYELGKLEHDLIHSILSELEELGAVASQKASNSTTLPLNEGRFLLLMSMLQELIPFLYVSVLENGPYTRKIEDVIDISPDIDVSRFPKSSSPLTDLKVIVGNPRQLCALVYLFEDHVSQEWFEPWENFNWVVKNLIPHLLEVVMGAGLSIPKVVNTLCKCFFRLCRTFGQTFVEIKVKPMFKELLVLPEEQLESFLHSKQTALTTAIVPVYAAGVLSTFNTEDERKQLIIFLQETMCTLALYQASLDGIKAALLELGTNPSNHDLLLTVLWDGVVHTSAQVRCTAARMFELLIKGVNDTLISTRIIPALVTLGNDPEISVRTSTIPALGNIIENVASREMLDRVYMQLHMFMDDPSYRDEHSLHVELIRTFARVGPNAEPRFRDEFVLPRLAAMALANNHVTNETKKHDIAMQLFEAYSAMSCCFINDQMIQEAMLPGLRCLRLDMTQIAPEHEEVVASMIREYEAKMEVARSIVEKSSSFSGHQTGASPAAASSGDDVRARVMNRIKDTNISNIFTRKK